MNFLMKEEQALLNKEHKNPRKSYQKNVSESTRSSSEASDELWEESHSGCSSCPDSLPCSSFKWESEISENGELFYIESDINGASEDVEHYDYEKPKTESEEKAGNVKQGHLINWIRRRDAKTLQTLQKSKCDKINQPHPKAQVQETVANSEDNKKELINVSLKVETIFKGSSLSEKFLGLSLGVLNENKVVVISIHPDGPVQQCKDLLVGDILHEINNIRVTPQNVENILGSLNFPAEVSLKIEKIASYNQVKTSKYQSSFVKALLEKNEALEAVLLGHPVGIVIVDMESQHLNKDDIIYSYPDKCVLSSCRGAFVTLFHLLAEINPKDECQSSSVMMKNQPTHILYKSENNFLFLIAIPKQKCTLKEATFLVDNVMRNILFTNQTLKRCFERNKKQELDHFFSLFFSRVLTNGFFSNASQFVSLENILSFSTREKNFSQFEDILPHAVWVPLPKEAQIQIDDALNELEANDVEHEEENILESQRLFNIIGSCLFHKGYLLLSHLPKEDLLDVYNFYRQNCLIQLFRNEPVKSLIIWKRVFPQSVNRGLPTKKLASNPTPSGKWFLLIVGQGYDSLAIILEVGICCVEVNGNAGLAVSYIEEAQDTLKHMQKLGMSSLASQWIESNSRYKTITPEEVFSRKANKKKENLLGLVKSLEGNSKPSALYLSSGSSKSSDVTTKKTRGFQHTSEDSVSQTASNVSEVSDENAPILGRRAERGRIFNEPASDSDSSGSDWDSSKDSNMRESVCSSGADNFCLGNLGEVMPAKLTTGPDYLLFNYLYLDGNEGVLVNAPLNSKRSTPKMMEVVENFRRVAQIIHSILANNIDLKKYNEGGLKGFINKSLVSVKEHGVLFECKAPESDCQKKSSSFSYWIVGKLFYTPQPREVYVCYCDDAPQNLIEIAFRLGLSTAG